LPTGDALSIYNFVKIKCYLLELRKCTYTILLCNAILVTGIFCYQYSTINNSAK